MDSFQFSLRSDIRKHFIVVLVDVCRIFISIAGLVSFSMRNVCVCFELLSVFIAECSVSGCRDPGVWCVNFDFSLSCFRWFLRKNGKSTGGGGGRIRILPDSRLQRKGARSSQLPLPLHSGTL